MLRFRNLGSGSSGNATLVEGRSGHSTTRVLVDCGLGLRQLEARLGRAGLALCQLDAVFITHEHADHVGCLLKLLERQPLRVFTSRGTYAGMGQPDLGDAPHFVADGETYALRDLQLSPFTVPHDAREPLQLTVSDGAARLGIATDLGHVTAHVEQSLAGCSALQLEFNHDPDMLRNSRYPEFLKARIAGRHGHLSNADALALVERLVHPGLRRLVAAHLSERNNSPGMVNGLLERVAAKSSIQTAIADPVHGTDWHDA